MSFLPSLDIVGSALTAERQRTDVILQNISNAKTTVTASGDPYRRKQVVFEERPLTFEETLNQKTKKRSGGVQVAQVVEDSRDFRPVYEPTNPQANEEGYVMYPNVDTTEEMVDLMAASNAYEANLTAFTLMKSMISRTLDMSK